MKRVLHISKYYYPFVGGVEQIARDCVLALQNNVEQEIICFDHNPHSRDSEEVVDGVRIVRVGQQMLISSQAIGRTYGTQLKREIVHFNPDVIIYHYPNPFVAHYLLRYIPANTQLIVYWHLDITRQKFLRKFFYGQNHRLLKRANKIVATSPNYIDGSPWLSQYREKCVVIPNCIDETRLTINDNERKMASEIKKKNKEKIICLAVGRHVPYKGFEYLIKASKLLDDRFEIRITGEGPLTEKLHELAKDDPKVHFLGLVSDDELKANLVACDIFCFSSITKNEAFGVALAEGMYFGHPAVTFTIPGSGVNYVNINRMTGIEVPNKNVKAYANAIITLGNDDEKRRKYGAAASKRVKEKFLFSSFKSNIINLIQ